MEGNIAAGRHSKRDTDARKDNLTIPGFWLLWIFRFHLLARTDSDDGGGASFVGLGSERALSQRADGILGKCQPIRTAVIDFRRRSSLNAYGCTSIFR